MSFDRDHMIKRNGTSLSLVQKVRGVGLFHSMTQTDNPYYSQGLWDSHLMKSNGKHVFPSKREKNVAVQPRSLDVFPLF